MLIIHNNIPCYWTETLSDVWDVYKMGWDGLWCPCCGCRLRMGPRLFKHKAKLRIKEKQKEKQIEEFHKVQI